MGDGGRGFRFFLREGGVKERWGEGKGRLWRDDSFGIEQLQVP